MKYAIGAVVFISLGAALLFGTDAGRNWIATRLGG